MVDVQNNQLVVVPHFNYLSYGILLSDLTVEMHACRLPPTLHSLECTQSGSYFQLHWDLQCNWWTSG